MVFIAGKLLLAHRILTRISLKLSETKNGHKALINIYRYNNDICVHNFLDSDDFLKFMKII